MKTAFRLALSAAIFAGSLATINEARAETKLDKAMDGAYKCFLGAYDDVKAAKGLPIDVDQVLERFQFKCSFDMAESASIVGTDAAIHYLAVGLHDLVQHPESRK